MEERRIVLRAKRGDREIFGMGAWIFGILAVILAFGALAVAGNALSTSKDAKDVAAVGGAGTKVTLTEFAIEPAMVDAPVDGTIAVTNAGNVEHDLAIKGTDLKTPMLKSGESATLSLKDLKQGNYTLFCEVSGHEGAGMKATLMLGTMSGGGSAAGTDDAALTAADATNNEAMATQLTQYVDQLKEGANTEGVGNQPLAPTVLPDGTKQFDLTAEVVDWEVEPGKRVKAWTYNGQVPGPLLKVGIGDRVRIVVQNELSQSTSLHLHGIETPNSMDGVPFVTQDPIKPGGSFAYEFVAKGPAVGMYHSHDYALTQVSDGMAGAILVGEEPVPAGYGPITQEVPMMLNDAGVIGFSLNGKSFPATAPIVAAPGETVEVHYMNEGQQIHPMHLHGILQLVIAKDGNPLPQPYLADTVNVAPGERYSVLIKPSADATGVWAWHCHILSHAEHEDGMMFGMVTTFIVR
jgi:FtsP/CotA-like multicopper oxidase with cupredoxin domain/plastocyanin